VLRDGRCSCSATELCRHLVRSVLAYQQQSVPASTSPAPPTAWNPGTITDDDLARHFKKPVLDKARAIFKQGLLVELVLGSKPTARFHQFAHTLRFQVPGDVRYVHCDCAEEPTCIHAALAVWAFRELPAGCEAAVVSTQRDKMPAPLD